MRDVASQRLSTLYNIFCHLKLHSLHSTGGEGKKAKNAHVHPGMASVEVEV